ncbi:hypothetical protein [Tahibacter soli]|uniref:Uncharacterized protein n=1 Tax=Tahibacter soli TaxID=2983605 RepID=A0A9X3YHU0_9GAMM|nr:hypothetical protein [Tahibacter soli]MDC8011281.1 hypothetical protein [Tahibacter soli]
MHNDAFSLFNTKLLFRTTAAPQRDHFAARSARRRLARLLAADCANDVPDAVADETDGARDDNRRIARRD